MTNKKKTTSKKTTKRKKSIKKILSYDTILLIVFFILLILVITLFSLVIKKHNEIKENPPANIIIPIYKDFTSYHFSISALGISNNKDYVFKISNYRNKKINPDNVNYEVKIENATASTIKVIKNKGNKNLMTDKKSSIIDGNISSEKKGEDVYRISMTSHKKLTDNDFIRVEISNKNIKEEKSE